MSKEKKYRFYFSQKQSDIDEDMWDIPTRFVFVKTPNGYKQYSECCSLKGSKCNWEDAELVYEADEMPEIITHEAIPELIKQLEHRLSNCIEPKFKQGDKCYGVIDTFAYTDVFPVEIRNTHLLYEVWDGEDTTKQHSTRIFATEEEAKAKLEELK